MKETQKTISEWGVKTFGYPKSPEFILRRMLVECKELEEKLDAGEQNCEKLADEVADIFIVGYQGFTTLGFDAHACIDHKMDINRHRKWKLHGDGTAQHVKE